MPRAVFERIVENTKLHWLTVLKGALLEVGCSEPKEVKPEDRHIVVSFIERRLPEDNFSVYRDTFGEDYGYLQRDSFDKKDFGIVKQKYGYEERG